MHKISSLRSGRNGQIDLFEFADRHQRRHRVTPPEAWLHDRYGIPYQRARLLAEHAGLVVRHD